jgi:hypothetical protein
MRKTRDGRCDLRMNTVLDFIGEPVEGSVHGMA